MVVVGLLWLVNGGGGVSGRHGGTEGTGRDL